MMVQNDFNVGAMRVGLSSLYLIPEFGWPTVFYVGGGIPHSHRAQVIAVPSGFW
jgi:hypothetical protein